MQFGIDAEPEAIPAEGALWWSWVVGGEGEEVGEGVEGVFPVVELGGDEAVGVVGGAEELVLPEGVVGVVDG
jgi:hypothetical protein